MYKHVCVCAYVLVCNQYLFCFWSSDMNNRSIAWWLRQIGLPEYTKTLESEYYGLEVCLLKSLFSLVLSFNLHNPQFHINLFLLSLFLFCFTAGFDECNRYRAEGRRHRGCNTQRNHPQPAFKIQTETGPILWWHSLGTCKHIWTVELGTNSRWNICWIFVEAEANNFVPHLRLDAALAPECHDHFRVFVLI